MPNALPISLLLNIHIYITPCPLLWSLSNALPLSLLLPFLDPEMKSILALHSPLALSPPLCNFLLLFILSISWLASYCDGACDVFICGDHVFNYPFGKKNSGCGDPTLQLECDEDLKMPLLNISGTQYYVLRPWGYLEGISNHSMIIIDADIIRKDKCDLFPSMYAQFWYSSQFHIADGYQHILLGKQCNQSDLYLVPNTINNILCNEHHYTNSTEGNVVCESVIDLPVKDLRKPLNESLQAGLEITWRASKYCVDCNKSKRTCDYRKTPSFCYCSGTSYQNKCSNDQSKRKITIIAGVATLVCALLIVVGFLLIVYRKRSSFFNQGIKNVVPISKIEKFLQDYVHEMPTRYSYSQLKKITNNFAHKLGEGGFGVVYKGKLPSKNLVAVKVLDYSRQSESQFMNEVATIGRIHHFHLVRLLGYCFEGFRSALMYEYMANGSLEKFIFAEKEQILSWQQLYSIGLGAARGLAYLHEECESRIIHFDIKPHNILLDEDFNPKISDFGLAKLCGRGEDHISMTAARGTPGYVAPELWSRNMGLVTDKSDVYSFGMLLLEMVGGRKNIDVEASRSSQLYFPEWIFKAIESGELEERLKGRGGGGGDMGWEEEKGGRRMSKVGLWCIQYNPNDRPSMSRVVKMLEEDADQVTDPPPLINRSSEGPLLSADESSTSTEIRLIL